MKIQQIRNATLKIKYGGQVILFDPWIQDRGTAFALSETRRTRADISREREERVIPLSDARFSQTCQDIA